VEAVSVCDARDGSALAPRAGCAPLDVSAPSSGQAGDRGGDSRAGGAARAGEPSLGGIDWSKGELVGIKLAASTVWTILKEAGIEPAPERIEQSWAEFERAQAASILECDSLTVDTPFRKRFYVLFFIELASRRVRLAGITTNPEGGGSRSRRATS
jgi:hypothetical protein